MWEAIDAALRREHGVSDLSSRDVYPSRKWRSYVLGLKSPEAVIDAIEIAFLVAMRSAKDSRYSRSDDVERVRSGIDELNRRFREHDLGYEMVVAAGDPIVVRVDSQYVHVEAVEPAIASLYAAGFVGPLAEFMKAHQEHRHGHNADAMNEAHKAFESTMKAICDARGWYYSPKANASQLIGLLMDNGLVSRSLEAYFGGIRAVLSSGVPTLRNTVSGHGGGANVVEIPDRLAAFTLHLAAANIVFLMSAHNAPP